jgi:hypothetical protein
MTGAILLGLVSTAGITLALHRWCRLPLAVAPALAIACLMIVLYAGAMAGWLKGTADILFAAGLAWFACELALAMRERWSSPLLQPGIIVPALLCALLYWRLRDASFVDWDDFSQWGMGSREMLERHKLVDGSSLVMLKDYPQATTLFHYFCLRLAGASEGGIMVAHAWLQVWPVAAALSGLSWRDLAVAVFLMAGVVFSVLVLGLGFHTAMVDHVVSVFFACTLICYLILQRSGASILWLAPLLFVLPLLKRAGFFFALVIVAAVAVDFVICRWEQRAKIVSLSAIAALAVRLAAPAAARLSWQRHLDAHGIGLTFPVEHTSVSRLLHEWSAQGSPQAQTVWRNFFAALSSRALSQTTAPNIPRCPPRPIRSSPLP